MAATEPQSHRATEMERQRDGEKKRLCGPSLHLCGSVAELRIVIFGWSFAELDRLLAAFARPRFMSADVANVAKIIEVVQSAVAPGL